MLRILKPVLSRTIAKTLSTLRHTITPRAALEPLEPRMLLSAVVGEHVFYKGSVFDTGGGSGHDAAIAVDKSALLPGQTATFANYTSYDRGLNGLMVDLSGTVPNLTAADFAFCTGNDNSPNGCTPVTAVPTVTVRPGAGVAGSTRVDISFADGAITNTWLQVTVLAGLDTGLSVPVSFCFGNAVGETGNSPTDARVDTVDELLARAGATKAASLTNPLDINRDGVVDAADQAIVHNHMTFFGMDLQLITPPAPPPLFSVTFASPNTASQQGYATDGVYHYTFHTNALYKKQNDASWSTVASNTSPFTGLTGVTHVGDGDYYNGYLYAPVEHWNGTATDHIYLVLYNAANLSYYYSVDVSASIADASAVAVAADRGLIYVSTYIANKIYIFNLADFSYQGSITLDIPTTHWQGIAYKNGFLYIDSDSPQSLYQVDPKSGTTQYLFDLSTVGVGESEGIDFSQSQVRYMFNGVVYYLTPTNLATGSLVRPSTSGIAASTEIAPESPSPPVGTSGDTPLNPTQSAPATLTPSTASSFDGVLTSRHSFSGGPATFSQNLPPPVKSPPQAAGPSWCASNLTSPTLKTPVPAALLPPTRSRLTRLSFFPALPPPTQMNARGGTLANLRYPLRQTLPRKPAVLAGFLPSLSTLFS